MSLLEPQLLKFRRLVIHRARQEHVVGARMAFIVASCVYDVHRDICASESLIR